VSDRENLEDLFPEESTIETFTEAACCSLRKKLQNFHGQTNDFLRYATVYLGLIKLTLSESFRI